MLTADEQRLLDLAADVSTRAHAPYSSFRVGAAVLDENGEMHVGCNVENGAYPEGTCAETGAIGAMVAAGGRRIRAAAVWGADVRDGNVCTPCGGCRQRLAEFADDDTRIVLGGPAATTRVSTLAELLPARFRLSR